MQIQRTRVFRQLTHTMQLLFILFGFLSLSAHAQGLVGAPVDVRYGQSSEIGQMADFGYDTVRDVSRVATCISFLIALFIPLHPSKKSKPKLVALEFLGLASIPFAVHLIGTFAINNFGCLCGGL